MSAFSSYILSAISTAVLCGLLQMLFGKDSVIAPVIKFVTGLVITICVISPILNNDFQLLGDYIDSIQTMSATAVWEGEDMAKNSMMDIIKERTETYILDRARDVGADVTAQVALSDGDLPVPVSVTVTGSVSPYTKTKLADIIQQELGISKEQQTWK